MTGSGRVTHMPIFGRKKDKEYQEAARLLAEDKPKEAAEKLRILYKNHLKDINVMVSLAVALIQGQEEPDKDSLATQEALSLLDRAAELEPKDVVPVFNKAVCLRNLGMLEDALTQFDRALEIEDRLTLAILHKAEINYELKRWQEAVELARLALIRDPGIEGALSWVPEAMEKGGMIDQDGKVVNAPWDEAAPDG
ncbi:MAG: CDC27 family protein [Candidatus Thorarchaeota archaeon]